MRCDNRLSGRHGVCCTPMEAQIDHLGRVRWTCQRCAWREAGRCWQCGRVRTNCKTRGLYCADCGHQSFRRSQRACETQPARKAKRRQYDAKRWRDPEIRAKRLETRRAWLAANPEKVKEYKRRDWQRHRAKALQGAAA